MKNAEADIDQALGGLGANPFFRNMAAGGAPWMRGGGGSCHRGRGFHRGGKNWGKGGHPCFGGQGTRADGAKEGESPKEKCKMFKEMMKDMCKGMKEDGESNKSCSDKKKMWKEMMKGMCAGAEGNEGESSS